VESSSDAAIAAHAGQPRRGVYGLFDRVLAIPWPQTLLGVALPAFKAIPGV